MKNTISRWLAIVAISIAFLMPQQVLGSRDTPCSYESSADIPTGVNQYIINSTASLGVDLWTKSIACTAQMDAALFKEAWETLQNHLGSLDSAAKVEFSEKITDDHTKMFFNLLPHDADYTLDIFYQHNCGRTEQRLAETVALQEQIKKAETEDEKARLHHGFMYLAKCLHVANSPDSKLIPGALLFGGLTHPLLEQAFLEKAAEETDKQFMEFCEEATEMDAKTVFMANTYTLLRETQRAGAFALSHIISTPDGGTPEQADLYMTLSNFYHPLYASIVGEAVTPEKLIENFVEFQSIVASLTYSKTAEDGSISVESFPAPALLTVASGDPEVDAVAKVAQEGAQAKIQTVAELEEEMNTIPAQLDVIKTRREAAGDDAEAIAVIEADKAKLIARLMEITAALS